MGAVSSLCFVSHRSPDYLPSDFIVLSFCFGSHLLLIWPSIAFLSMLHCTEIFYKAKNGNVVIFFSIALLTFLFLLEESSLQVFFLVSLLIYESTELIELVSGLVAKVDELRSKPTSKPLTETYKFQYLPSFSWFSFVFLRR